MICIDCNRTSNKFFDVNVGTKTRNFNIHFILNKYNIMIVIQKLKLMHEFASVINVECVHSSLHANLLMHNCARAKHTKT